MNANHRLNEKKLADALGELKAQADNGLNLTPDTDRLAFIDPEFMLRSETRGIRMQIELLKPELDQRALGVEHTIVVYGSARFVSKEQAEKEQAAATASGDAQRIARARLMLRQSYYYEQAREFARLVASKSLQRPPDERLYICTGGGPGIMEAANRGAREAGALTVGLNITLPHEQSSNPYVSPELCFRFHYFPLRKLHFMMRAKALVAFPGGFGTLDEIFEVLTLVQTRKSGPVPVILFGSAYWKRLIDFDFLVEEGVVSADDIRLFRFCDDPQEACEQIQAFYKV